MHPVLALFAPDYAIERRQRQTRGGIHRPDNGNPTHGLPLSDCVYVSVICRASSKPSAQTSRWYRLSRTRIAASVGSLIQLSPATTTLHGSLPARAVAAFFTRV